jgi:hypothetical protein
VGMGGHQGWEGGAGDADLGKPGVGGWEGGELGKGMVDWWA